MSIERISLLNSLFQIINENDEGDTNYKLAYYFLMHYDAVTELNIYDVSAECFVSRSSVRRFCKILGYNNFLELKKDVTSHQIDYYDNQYDYYMQHGVKYIENSNLDNYKAILRNEINSMIEELDTILNNALISEICRRIHNSEHVVFLVSDTASSQVKDFQRAMLFHNKMIHIITETFTNNQLINRMESNDYLAVISGSGTFGRASKDYIIDSNAYKVLYTFSQIEQLENGFDQVIHLSKTDRSLEARSVYGTYGFRFMFDVIYSYYIQKYGSSIKKRKD